MLRSSSMSPSESQLFEHLECTKVYLEGIEANKDVFLRRYPIWRENRLKNIDTLENIASYLDSIRTVTDVGRIVGTTAQIVGAAMTFVGASAKLLYYGLKAVLFGSGVRLTCDATEPILNTKMMNDACFALEKDRDDFKMLGECFIYSAAFEKNIEIFGSYSYFREALSCVRKIVSGRHLHIKLGEYMNSDWIADMKSFPYMKTLKGENEEAYNIIMAIISDYDTRNIFLEISEVFYKIEPIFYTIWKSLPKIAGMFPFISQISESALFDYAISFTDNPFWCPAAIALRTFNVLKIMKRLDQSSEHAQKIREMTKEMSDELQNISAVYNTLARRQ